VTGGRAGRIGVGLVGLSLAGAGVVGGVAAQRVLVRRLRRAPEPPGDDTRAPLAATERYVLTADGASLRVLEQGAGRPIVLLHGLTLSAEVWGYQLAELAAAGYRVVALDQRGHGCSDVGTGELTLARLADDLSQILTQLDLQDVMLVGHSMGGMAALRFLSEPPAEMESGRRVSSLALVATSASPVYDSGVPGAKALVSLVRPIAIPAAWLASRLPGRSLLGNDLTVLASRLAFGDAPVPAHLLLTGRIAGAVAPRVAAELMVDIVGFDLVGPDMATLRAIDVPTTVVVGSNDLLTPLRHAQAMADVIPDAELVVLEGCGHMVMLERPDRLNAILVGLAERAGAVKKHRLRT